MNTEENWLTLLDYAYYTKTSVSTIRRHIKQNKLVFKKVNGRYYILTPRDSFFKKNKVQFSSQAELENLKRKLRRVQEERDELLMLVTLYEKESPQKIKNNSLWFLPDVPLS